MVERPLIRQDDDMTLQQGMCPCIPDMRLRRYLQ